MLRAISGSTRTVLAGFVASLVILGASLALNSAAEEESAPLRAPAAVPTRVPFDQAQSDAMQFQALYGLFYTLQPYGKNQARFFVPITGPFQGVVGHHNFYVGSTFRAHDRHYSFDFKVKKIDAKGIVIAYSGRQGPETFNYGGDVSGQVRLGWRSRPAPTPMPTRR